MSQPITDTATLEAALASLSPEAQIVVLAYGAVFPCSCEDEDMAKVLRRAGFTKKGRIVPAHRYVLAQREVVRAGLLIAEDDARRDLYFAQPEWAAWLAIEAHRRDWLGRIEESWDGQLLDPCSWGERAESKFRRGLIQGHWDAVAERADEEGPLAWHWLLHPGAMDLLDTLPDALLRRALASLLDRIIKLAEPPEPLLTVCRKHWAEIPALIGDESFVRMMQGDIDGAVAIFDELTPEISAAPIVEVARWSTHALAATLKGDDARAIGFLGQAVKAERARTKKRSVFPQPRAFALALLSLVRDGQIKNMAQLNGILRSKQREFVDRELLILVRRAAEARDGLRVSSDKTPHYDVPVAFDLLVKTWSRAWRGDLENASEEQVDILRRFALVAVQNGYSWLAAEILVMLGQMDASPPEEIEYQGEMLESRTAGDVMLERMRVIPLSSSVVQPVPEWEYPLRALEIFAHETKKKGPARKKATAPAGPGRRLVWQLRRRYYDTVYATAREQRLYKNGNWSKGREVSLRRLFSSAPTLDYLTDQDRAVAATITQAGRRSMHPPYYVPAKGLHVLAGHPHVYNEQGESIEVVRREVELSIQEDKGQLVATVSPHIDRATSKTYDVMMADERRCEVTRFTAGHRRLCEIVPPDGLRMPVEARDRLVVSVSELAAEVRVQGDAGAGVDAVRSVEADPGSWVRLEPSGDGLTVAVLVQPVTGSQAYFRPGAGMATVIVQLDGESVQAQRDLDAEIRHARALAGACPTLAGLGSGSSMVLPDTGDCLRLVDELGVAEARCLWPQGQPLRVVARADTSSVRLSVRSAADWFEATGDLAIDAERTMDLRELLELADKSRHARFIELGDGEFVALTTALRRQLDDLGSLAAPRGKKKLRVHALAALALRDFVDGTQLTADSGWRDQRKRLRDAEALEISVPSTLQAELRPYQTDGFRWLARLSHWGAGACLADDMGLGKTVQTLAALLIRAPEGPALVVAPTSVVANWVDEARRFAPTLNVRVYTGPAASRAPLLEDLGPFDVVVTTYDLLRIDADSLTDIDWNTAVLDEAQAIKNHATKRARAVRRLNAGFRVVTTGTPVQNNLMDLYSLFAFLNPGLLGSLKRFRENFVLSVERDGDAVAGARLRRLIKPFVLRRLKADVLDDLPPRTEVTLRVEMSPEEASLYEALRRRAVEDLDTLSDDEAASGTGRLQVLAHLTRLRLACCNPRLVKLNGGSGRAPASSKLAIFAETLDELRRGNHKVLVFSQFVRHLKLVEEHVAHAGIPYQYLDGSTPAKARRERIRAFQAGDGDAFLISLKAGGVGLNLTAADYVIHMDPWWNPAAEDQASDRAHRIGQTRPVTIYRLVTKDTIEEKIVELHRHKRALADRLLEGADAPARLSADELLALLRGSSA